MLKWIASRLATFLLVTRYAGPVLAGKAMLVLGNGSDVKILIGKQLETRELAAALNWCEKELLNRKAETV